MPITNKQMEQKMRTVSTHLHPDNDFDYTDQYSYTEEQRQEGLKSMVWELIRFNHITIEHESDEDKNYYIWLSDLIHDLEPANKTEVLLMLLDLTSDPVEAVEELKLTLAQQLEFTLSNEEIDLNIYRGNHL